MLLAAFTPARPGERVLELGCGAGAAALCLAVRVPGLDLPGSSCSRLMPSSPGNAAENGLALPCVRGDLRPRPPRSGEVSTTCSRTRRSTPPRRRLARPGPRPRPSRGRGELADWIDAGLRRLCPAAGWRSSTAPRGSAPILAALEGRAGAVEVLPVSARTGRPAERVLVRARKGRAAPLTLWPPLTFHEGEAHAGDAES